MNKQKQIPLSESAYDLLSANRKRYWKFPLVMSIIFLVVAIITTVLTADFTFSFYGVSAALAIWLIWGMLVGWKWAKNRRKIFSINQSDHESSQKLRSELRTLSAIRVSEYSILEGEIKGNWKPFSVSYELSRSLREALFDGIDSFGKDSLPRQIKELMQKYLEVIEIPNPLDTSSELFLNDGEKTLRVVVPSPRVTRSMLEKIIERWRNSVNGNSHLELALDIFRMGDDVLLAPISHMQIIDSIKLSIEMPLEQRPSIIVRGELIKEGLALATGLEVDGKQYIFFPSGFFQALRKAIVPIIY
jgi:hypothetical protein